MRLRSSDMPQSIRDRLQVKPMMTPQFVSHGQRHTPGTMNKLESAYNEHLRMRYNAGEIAAWYFESVKLRIGDRCWYTPDFLVIMPNGTVEFHEVKGFWRDDARVKTKAAASIYSCFVFRAFTREKHYWKEERIMP